MIVDRVLQDPLEHERQLLRGPIRIFLGQLEHRVLDDVQRRIFVAYGVHGLLERAALDTREERGQLGDGSQGVDSTGAAGL
jgi:hypothetical protein